MGREQGDRRANGAEATAARVIEGYSVKKKLRWRLVASMEGML